MGSLCNKGRKGVWAMIEISVTDEIEPFLARTLKHNEAYLRHVSKSLGYFIQKRVKEGMISGSPGGESFAERIPWSVRQAVQGGNAARSWYGKMRNAVVYQYENGVVRVGWGSVTAASYGEKQESGYATAVTGAVRAKWAKAGRPLKRDTTELETPARPVFEPMANLLYPEFVPYIEEKLKSYMQENVSYSKKSRRKYKVY